MRIDLCQRHNNMRSEYASCTWAQLEGCLGDFSVPKNVDPKSCFEIIIVRLGYNFYILIYYKISTQEYLYI